MTTDAKTWAELATLYDTKAAEYAARHCKGCETTCRSIAGQCRDSAARADDRATRHPAKGMTP